MIARRAISRNQLLAWRLNTSTRLITILVMNLTAKRARGWSSDELD
jgi:hypothetical protein